MADIKHIIIAMMGTIILVGGIALIVGSRSGEVLLLQSEPYDETLPGPLSPESEDTNNKKPEDTMNDTKNTEVTFKTNKGDIVLELFEDTMPITTGNFLKLAKDDFYNNTKFHRVIDGFMIQGGDPNSKGANPAVYGQGGPGYTIQDEFIAGPLLTNVRGTIAMANTGQPNSGGSQFFINLVDNTGLDFDKPPMGSSHPVFGRVVRGMDVVDAIGKVETGPRDVPVEPVVISEIVVGE